MQTHSAITTVEMKNHQRLEFIGDAVLDYCEDLHFSVEAKFKPHNALTVVVRYLFDKNQRASPGDLSILKVRVPRS